MGESCVRPVLLHIDDVKPPKTPSKRAGASENRGWGVSPRCGSRGGLRGQWAERRGTIGPAKISPEIPGQRAPLCRLAHMPPLWRNERALIPLVTV